MKKYKHLLTILTFFAVLLITNNVNANLQHYGYMTCGGKRWTPESDCSQGTANSDVISINYNENGSLSFSITKDAFDEDHDDQIDNMEIVSEDVYMTKFKPVGSRNYTYFKYDLTSLHNYYSQSSNVPENIIVFVKHYNTGAYEMDRYVYYYFGTSEYELFDKTDSNQYDSGIMKKYYFSVNNNLSQANQCLDLTYYKLVLEEKVLKFGAESDEVNEYAANLENKCQNYLAFNDNPNNACYSMCRDLENSIADMGVDIFNETNSCGFGEKMVAWIIRILKILRFIVPTLVIVLTTYEYINAFMAAEDDAIKKVGGRLGKRLFIMILFFVLPSLIQFVLNVFNVPGFDSSNPYCIK